MISMSVNHPDIEDFIDIKSDLTKITKANISVQITDKFMEAVKNDELFKCEFIVESNNEKIVKLVNAREIFMKLCKNNHEMAEPGILFWDNINNHNIMSADDTFEYAGVNPCAEEPLPAGGSCLLGSINLSEFVKEPFNVNAEFDIEEFEKAVKQCVIGLDEVLDEGLDLHPLDIQKETVTNYRQIGLGVMGIADMLMKLGLVYGEPASLKICDRIARVMANAALQQSALLAKENGPFPAYNREAIRNSTYIKEVANADTWGMIGKYGLRHSQLLTVPPCGSISTMINTSGGIEPVFSISYTRKTESIGGVDQYHEVFTNIAEEYMTLFNKKKEELPRFFITSQEIPYMNRIKMQSVWQKYIDAAISSTVNLPYETTVEDVYDIYMSAWEHKLKGLTIYRDGCSRAGILITENTTTDGDIEIKKEEPVVEDKTICPECGTEIAASGGCGFCLNCGWSKCH